MKLLHRVHVGMLCTCVVHCCTTFHCCAHVLHVVVLSCTDVTTCCTIRNRCAHMLLVVVACYVKFCLCLNVMYICYTMSQHDTHTSNYDNVMLTYMYIMLSYVVQHVRMLYMCCHILLRHLHVLSNVSMTCTCDVLHENMMCMCRNMIANDVHIHFHGVWCWKMLRNDVHLLCGVVTWCVVISKCYFTLYNVTKSSAQVVWCSVVVYMSWNMFAHDVNVYLHVSWYCTTLSCNVHVLSDVVTCSTIYWCRVHVFPDVATCLLILYNVIMRCTHVLLCYDVVYICLNMLLHGAQCNSTYEQHYTYC